MLYIYSRWYFVIQGFHDILYGSVFNYRVLTVVVLPFSILPRPFYSANRRGQTILRTIFILFKDVPSSKSIVCISRSFRSSVHPLFFGSMILGEWNSRNGWSLRAGWETSIWRGPDSGKLSWRSRDPRRFGSCLLASGMRRREHNATPLMTKREKEERGALRGSRKRIVARPVAN